MKKRLVPIIIMIVLTNLIFAQTKYEKEYKLDKKEVPQSALEFIETLRFDSKIKWYKEEGIDKTSIEAKTKFHSKKYSIEFDNDGKIEDIEIEKKWKHLSETIKSSITEYLKDNYNKHKVCKSQIQFTGQSNNLIDAIVNKTFEKTIGITTNYEIVAEVKHKGRHQQMEFLFDSQGGIISKSIILPKNTDNLEY